MIKQIDIDENTIENGFRIFCFLVKNIYKAILFTGVWLMIIFTTFILLLIYYFFRSNIFYWLLLYITFFSIMNPMILAIEEYYHVKSIKILKKQYSINKLIIIYDNIRFSCTNVGVSFAGEFKQRELLYIYSSGPLCTMIILLLLLATSLFLSKYLLVVVCLSLLFQPIMSLNYKCRGSDGEKILNLHLTLRQNYLETVHYCIGNAIKTIVTKV